MVLELGVRGANERRDDLDTEQSARSGLVSLLVVWATPWTGDRGILRGGAGSRRPLNRHVLVR